MIKRKAYVFKLKTNRLYKDLFTQYSGCSRYVWNKALSLNLDRLKSKQPILWYNEMAFWLTFWKSTDECSFLKSAPSQTLQQTLKDLHRAFKDAFDKTQPNKRIPRFKTKSHGHGIRFPQGFKLEGCRVFLPKIGWIRFFKSRDIEGKVKSITVKKRAGSWFISVLVQSELADIRKHPADTSVGIDRGVVNLAALSDGRLYLPKSSLKKLGKKLAKAQRKLSKKEKFSNNWKKQRARIARIHHKIANCRNDRLHWVSSKISKSHAITVLEDLKVKSMTKTAKGTLDAPGRNVKAKSGLNRSILDKGWSSFCRMLEYKQKWKGGKVFFVPAHYTSQKCSACGNVSPLNRKAQSVFNCTNCRHNEHADINAAKNILAAGQAVIACGAEALATAMKQEPAGTGNPLPLRAACAA